MYADRCELSSPAQHAAPSLSRKNNRRKKKPDPFREILAGLWHPDGIRRRPLPPQTASGDANQRDPSVSLENTNGGQCFLPLAA